MQSNAPLERLLSAVMTLDACADSADYAVELRCLMRKIEWVANEAETAVQRCSKAGRASEGTPTGRNGLGTAA